MRSRCETAPSQQRAESPATEKHKHETEEHGRRESRKRLISADVAKWTSASDQIIALLSPPKGFLETSHIGFWSKEGAESEIPQIA